MYSIGSYEHFSLSILTVVCAPERHYLEEKGIYEENLKLCTDQVRLPMTNVIESLNVSVAAGIFIYEAIRQRGQ